MTQELIMKFIWIGAGVFAGILLLATVVKLREVWRCRNWLTTSGRIVTSKVESRPCTGVGEKAGTMGNFPLVTFEYTVRGRLFQGSRISVGEQAADVGVESMLDKYPQGAEVDVYYNPDDPEESVLERDLPPDFAKAIGGLLFFVVACAIILPIGIQEFSARLVGYIDKPENAMLVTLLLGMAGFVVLTGLALQRQVKQMAGWPSTGGTIVSTAVEAYRSDKIKEYGNRMVHYRPRVIYAYEVRGRRYQSDQLAPGGKSGGMMVGWLSRLLQGKKEAAAQPDFVDAADGEGNPDHVPFWVTQTVAGYRPGANIVVFYNPDNPAEAVVEKRAKGIPVLWAVAAGLVVIALMAAGIIGS